MARNDEAENITPRSRDTLRPSFASRFALKTEGAARPSSEGAGNAGCPLHPRPVCKGSKHTVVTTVAPESPGIPARNGFTTYFVLSLVTGLFVTIASEKHSFSET